MDTILAQSLPARSEVQAAVSGLDGCQLSPDQATRDFEDAIRVRKEILAQLDDLPSGALPEGATLISGLKDAFLASVNADGHYVSWVSLIADQGCQAADHRNSEWAAAEADNTVATSAKERFSTSWNAVAPSYGFSRYTPKDF